VYGARSTGALFSVVVHNVASVLTQDTPLWSEVFCPRIVTRLSCSYLQGARLDRIRLLQTTKVIP